MSQKEIKWMMKQGARAILSLTEDELPEEWFSDSDLAYLSLPIRDHTSPPVEVMDKAVRFIETQIQAGRAVVVHCNAGRGRTGTILAAYLIHANSSPEDAINYVRRMRPFSIEKRQEASVIEYFRWLNKK